jgi:polyhydroxyalkanoate synthesis repressor PhaR
MSTKPTSLVSGIDLPAQDSTQTGKTEVQRDPVVIKKYANRRLYNTETSAYVTLFDLAEMVRSERDFVVYDAKSGEDLTHAVLTQIIVDEESKNGQNLLPIGFLRQLIRFYGHSIERIVPSYLELSLNSLTRDKDKYQNYFAGAFGAAALEAMHEQAINNLAMFEKAFTMFSPFQAAELAKKAAEAEKSAPPQTAAAPKAEDIADLRSQLAAMQEQLDRLAKRDE